MSLWVFMGLAWLSTVLNTFSEIPANILSKKLDSIKAVHPEIQENGQCLECTASP